MVIQHWHCLLQHCCQLQEAGCIRLPAVVANRTMWSVYYMHTDRLIRQHCMYFFCAAVGCCDVQSSTSHNGCCCTWILVLLRVQAPAPTPVAAASEQVVSVHCSACLAGTLLQGLTPVAERQTRHDGGRIIVVSGALLPALSELCNASCLRSITWAVLCWLLHVMTHVGAVLASPSDVGCPAA
jgi:hypothetical protein